MNASDLRSGRVKWRSPSNIAIVKYWGKHGEQLPTNPSISLTLSEAATTTSIDYKPGSGLVEFLFEGNRNEEFEDRVTKYINRIAGEHSVLHQLDLKIESSNSFPHSAGIASSASAMSALALCLGSIVHKGAAMDERAFLEEASFNARLGSGSASRSVAGPVMLWGATEHLLNSHDEWAVQVEDVDPVFSTFRDSILIVSKEEKQVKSTAGHALMNGHPYAQQRFDNARNHIGELLSILRNGDLGGFVDLCEQEALDLHAMMMTSVPPYLLIRPGTVAVIEALHDFRAQSGLPVCMTLDAGPNIHMLYPESAEAQVRPWIDSELLRYCADGMCIHDRVGTGAKQLEG